MKNLFFGCASKHPKEIGQSQQEELLLSETYNFRSLSQIKGKKAGPEALIRLAYTILSIPLVK